MQDNQYQVIFLGQIHDGFDEGDVRKQLKSIFKDKVDYVFNNVPIVIKKNMSKDEAINFSDQLSQMGAVCKVDHAEPTDISGNTDSDTCTQNLETSSENKPHMVCPSCDCIQEEATDCRKCGIIIEKFQKKTSSQEPSPKQDSLQKYLEQMCQPIPEESSEKKTKKQFKMALRAASFLICCCVIAAIGWSYHFFVYQKPWMYSDVESIAIKSVEEKGPVAENQHIESQQETISMIQKALQDKNSVKKSKKTLHSSASPFRLKNIPLPLLKQYQGKYVWVTCDNDAVHQGTLDAVYTEQIILKKPQFNLTIPINRSMIKLVELDLSDVSHEKESVAAYQDYKRKTEEVLQTVSVNHLGSYINKNIRVYLNNGQLYEGMLRKCGSKKITIENVVYGQMITLVIRKETIDKILF